jgi:hypothetical protein
MSQEGGRRLITNTGKICKIFCHGITTADALFTQKLRFLWVNFSISFYCNAWKATTYGCLKYSTHISPESPTHLTQYSSNIQRMFKTVSVLHYCTMVGCFNHLKPVCTKYCDMNNSTFLLHNILKRSIWFSQ